MPERVLQGAWAAVASGDLEKLSKIKEHLKKITQKCPVYCIFIKKTQNILELK